MPTIYADNKDARIVSHHTQWFRARDAISGSTQSIPSASESSSPYICGYSPHNKTIPEFNNGAGNHHLIRSFYYFDFSGVSGTVASATLSIYGLTNGGLDCRIIKSTAFGGDGGTALVTSDWAAIPGYNSGGTLSGNVTEYSTEITSWSTSGYNNFGLNGTAISDINSVSRLIVCLIDSDFDYPHNSSPFGGNIGGFIPNPPHNGGYYSEVSSILRRPKIDYVLAATSDIDKVNGVSRANIGKINAVAISNIESILDVQ